MDALNIYDCQLGGECHVVGRLPPLIRLLLFGKSQHMSVVALQQNDPFGSEHFQIHFGGY